MKISNFTDFEKHVAENSPERLSRLYMILGKEPFERKLAVDLLIEKALGEAKREWALRVFDGEKLNLEDFFTELKSFGFFAKNRVVVLENGDKPSKAFTEEIEAYFQNLNPSVCLIISAAAINRATNYYKKGEKAGVVLEFPEEKPWEKEKSMKEFAMSYAAKAKKRLDGFAAESLIKQVGTDQALIFQELEKLTLYTGERADITTADIAAVSATVNVENAWQLGEAIFKRDAPSALRISRSLLEDGSQVIGLLRQIRSQVQTEYQVCSLLADQGTADDVSRQFPYMRGQILTRHISMAQNYGMTRFKKAMLLIDEAELMAKNSMIDPELLIERLIIKLVS